MIQVTVFVLIAHKRRGIRDPDNEQTVVVVAPKEVLLNCIKPIQIRRHFLNGNGSEIEN